MFNSKTNRFWFLKVLAGWMERAIVSSSRQEDRKKERVEK